MDKKDNKDNKGNPPKSSYTKGQRIFAMIAVILLLGMYITTLFAALFTSPAAPELFKMCIGSTLFLPIMFWFYIQVWKAFVKKPEIVEKEAQDDMIQESADKTESNVAEEKKYRKKV